MVQVCLSLSTYILSAKATAEAAPSVIGTTLDSRAFLFASARFISCRLHIMSTWGNEPPCFLLWTFTLTDSGRLLLLGSKNTGKREAASVVALMPP
ncbi:hypothetical protein J3F84DRAFT_216249 [Trichoderma pleuroticola]